MAQAPIKVAGGLRTNLEAEEAHKNKTVFEANPSSWEV